MPVSHQDKLPELMKLNVDTDSDACLGLMSFWRLQAGKMGLKIHLNSDTEI